MSLVHLTSLKCICSYSLSTNFITAAKLVV